MAFSLKKKGGIPMNDLKNYSDKQKEIILEILIDMDRIHRENTNNITVDELKLKVIVRFSLSLWKLFTWLKIGIFTKIKTLLECLSRILLNNNG
jgi:hypothetical protein